MGYRLHVHKKHVIDYGKEDFNWRCDEINHLLRDTCSCCFNDENFVESSTEIEVLRKDFKELYSEILTGTDEQIRERLLDTYCLSEDIVKDLEEIARLAIYATNVEFLYVLAERGQRSVFHGRRQGDLKARRIRKKDGRRRE